MPTVPLIKKKDQSAVTQWSKSSLGQALMRFSRPSFYFQGQTTGAKWHFPTTFEIALQQYTGKPFLFKKQQPYSMANWFFLKFISEVATNPKLIWCPRPGCETVCPLTEEVSHKTTKKKFFGMLLISRNCLVASPSVNFLSFYCKTHYNWFIDSPCPTVSRLLADPNKKTHNPFTKRLWWMLDFRKSKTIAGNDFLLLSLFRIVHNLFWEITTVSYLLGKIELGIINYVETHTLKI